METRGLPFSFWSNMDYTKIQPPKPADWWMDTERREKRIKRLSKKGYSPDGIAKKTGYNLGYVRRVLFGYNK